MLIFILVASIIITLISISIYILYQSTPSVLTLIQKNDGILFNPADDSEYLNDEYLQKIELEAKYRANVLRVLQANFSTDRIRDLNIISCKGTLKVVGKKRKGG